MDDLVREWRSPVHGETLEELRATLDRIDSSDPGGLTLACELLSLVDLLIERGARL